MQADEPGQLEHDGAVQGTKGTQRVLAGSADVEQARLEGEGRRKGRS